MSARTQGFQRRHALHTPVIDGHPANPAAVSSWRARLQSLLVSNGERAEAELEARLRAQPAPSRPNTLAVISPKGGVGKTTTALLVGERLARCLHLRVIAVDVNPDFGTLAAHAPDHARSDRTLLDLLHDADKVTTATQLRPYLAPLPSGLHLLAAPRDPHATTALTPDSYGQLLAYLAVFYDLVILDCGTGVTGPLASWALKRADQTVIVTTPEWITSAVVLDALDHLPNDHTTVAINKSYLKRPTDLQTVQQQFRDRRLHQTVTVPHDDQLAAMLDTATYTHHALRRDTRIPITQLALATAQQLA